MTVGRVSLRLSLWSSAQADCTGLSCPFATAIAAEPLIIDPRLVILPHEFERLDLNHQSNIGRGGQKRQSRSLSGGQQWENKGEAHETS
jgi:hypothetical protein